MNKTALVLGIGAGLMLAANAASAAGSCSVEISAVEQALAKDDGLNATGAPTELGVQTPSASTDAPSATGTTTAAPSGTASGTASSTQPAETGTSTTIDPSSDAATNTGITSGTTAGTTAGTTGGTPPAPSVTETSRAGEMTTSAGGHAAALASLAKAKNLAASGQEEACMTEVTAAKTALGLE